MLFNALHRPLVARRRRLHNLWRVAAQYPTPTHLECPNSAPSPLVPHAPALPRPPARPLTSVARRTVSVRSPILSPLSPAHAMSVTDVSWYTTNP